MEFTYGAYRGLLSLLREQGRAFRNYHEYAGASSFYETYFAPKGRKMETRAALPFQIQ